MLVAAYFRFALQYATVTRLGRALAGRALVFLPLELQRGKFYDHLREVQDGKSGRLTVLRRVRRTLERGSGAREEVLCHGRYRR